MDDILKRIKEKEKAESSPLDELLPKEEEPFPEEGEEEVDITHYGITVAGSERVEESGKKGGFQEVDLEAEPKGEGMLGGPGIREISIDELGKDPDPPSPTEAPAGDEERVIRLRTEDERKVKYIRLISALIEASLFEQAMDAMKELRNLYRI